MNLKLLTEFKELLLNELYPIGKTEIFYDNADHSNYLGFKWERTALDRFIKGYSPSVNTVASTGGEKTHTLTINEIPDHNHTVFGYPEASDDGTMYGLSPSQLTGYGTYNTKYCGRSIYLGEAAGSHCGGQAHNNEPQFQIFAIWRRVS